MSAAEDNFAEAVLACVEDVNALLPRLAQRYSDRVMVMALAEHVGAALQLLMSHGVATPEQARHMLAHMELAAFGNASR
jgi:hypothetical protein